MKPLRSLFLIVGFLGLTTTALTAAEKPLNVVFILADDLGWGELGSYGQKKIPTPHLDRLAKEGSRFPPHAVC
jgi:arylsulfatase A